MIWTNSAETVFHALSRAPLVRFSVLALSSIFFLVDPFAAIPSFLAITESADPARRKRMARKGAVTCFIVLSSFAVGGQLIFRLFGITLPAFEIAGGLILLRIAQGRCRNRAPGHSYAGWPRSDFFGDGAGGPGAFALALGDGRDSGLDRVDRADLVLGAGRGRESAPGNGRNRHSHPGAHHGTFVGSPGNAVLCQWTHGLRDYSQALIADAGQSKMDFPTEA